MTGISIEAQAGVWTETEPNVFRGVVDATLRSTCLSGSETATNYTISGKVKIIDAQRAGVICPFSYAEDYSERYAECILDLELQKLSIKLAYAGTVIYVGERPFPLTANVEYVVTVITRIESDATGTLIFKVNGVTQLLIETLTPVFATGMFGFSVDDDEVGKMAEFIGWMVTSQFYGNYEKVKRLAGYTEADDTHDDAIYDALIDAGRIINDRLAAQGATVPLTEVPGMVHMIADYLAAGLLSQPQTPNEPKHQYTVTGEELLDTYITQTYREVEGGVHFRIMEADP